MGTIKVFEGLKKADLRWYFVSPNVRAAMTKKLERPSSGLHLECSRASLRWIKVFV